MRLNWIFYKYYLEDYIEIDVRILRWFRNLLRLTESAKIFHGFLCGTEKSELVSKFYVTLHGPHVSIPTLTSKFRSNAMKTLLNIISIHQQRPLPIDLPFLLSLQHTFTRMRSRLNLGDFRDLQRHRMHRIFFRLPARKHGKYPSSTPSTLFPLSLLQTSLTSRLV